MAPQAKTEALLVRMGVDEASMLTALSDHSGLSRADVIRQLIRREHKAVLPNVASVQAVAKPDPARAKKALPKTRSKKK